MAFDINEIRANLTFGGARPTAFRIQVANPVNASGDEKLTFTAEAASLPGSDLGTIQIPYFGRKIKLAGDRTFAPWEVTIQNDEDFLVRNALEEWSNRVNTLRSNLRAFGSARPSEYKSVAIIEQLSVTGGVVRTYQFNGLFPVSLTPIETNWDSTDQIERFQVRFEYDWHVVIGGNTGDAGGEA